jgi:hypothetical protein
MLRQPYIIENIINVYREGIVDISQTKQKVGNLGFCDARVVGASHRVMVRWLGVPGHKECLCCQ